MANLDNIQIIENEDGMVSFLVDGQPISDKYGMKFDANVVQDIQALALGDKVKLIEQFIFSHTDLNFEHSYYYVTGIERLTEQYRLVKSFVYRIKIDNQPEIEHIISKQGEPLTPTDIRQFIEAHVQKSLNDLTDLNYAY
jgi:hypothetical protein